MRRGFCFPQHSPTVRKHLDRQTLLSWPIFWSVPPATPTQGKGSNPHQQPQSNKVPQAAPKPQAAPSTPSRAAPKAHHPPQHQQTAGSRHSGTHLSLQGRQRALLLPAPSLQCPNGRPAAISGHFGAEGRGWVRHLRAAAGGPGLAAAMGDALMRARAVKSDLSPITGLKNMTSSALASLGRAQQQVCAVVFHAGVECTKTSLANSGNQHKQLDDKRFYFAKQSLYSNKYNCKLD